MNLRNFLLADSVLLDLVAVVALVTGEAAMAGLLFVLAAVVFAAFLAVGARHREVAATRVSSGTAS